MDAKAFSVAGFYQITEIRFYCKRSVHADVKKEETLYIGDSGVDVETALNAGVNLAAVLWGFRPKAELEEKGATIFIEKTEEILTLLQ